MEPRNTPIAERLLPITIAALGLAAAWGTQHYLAIYLTFWPALLAAGAIEMAYICLALMRAGVEPLRSEIKSTVTALVLASVAFNFGHAYQVAVPGGLMPGTARFEILALLQAMAIAGFVPWIAYRLSSVQGGIAGEEAENSERENLGEQLLERVQADMRTLATERDQLRAQLLALQESVKTSTPEPRKTRRAIPSPKPMPVPAITDGEI